MLAALHALMNDDLESAITALTPGGIEAQERAGQVGFVASDTLPIECVNATREQMEALGIQFGEPIDDLFVNVCLPEGWTKAGTEHSMHSDLLDEQGRNRAGIFYKATFYDRRADMHLVCRYRAHYQPVGGWDSPDSKTAPVHGVVKDQEAIIWHTEPLELPTPDADRLAFYDAQDALTVKATAWLDEQFPNWRDPLAYWDEQ